MRWMREQIMEILEAIYKLSGRPKPLLRDNRYVKDRLGVCDRTIRRFIEKGDLRVAQTINKFNYYLADDVERLYMMYRCGR
ncbi:MULTISPECIES: MerR family transcriptional regulator [Sphingobacterium]|uniref:MerR family transcriptional regulator n=2 Tax=Sphingobacteriaceae TaxID=84566 RepID=UPI0013DA792F|nr:MULTISPECIES: MerR family transcriptional regulator [unclassified Sphingobacterium]